MLRMKSHFPKKGPSAHTRVCIWADRCVCEFQFILYRVKSPVKSFISPMSQMIRSNLRFWSRTSETRRAGRKANRKSLRISRLTILNIWILFSVSRQIYSGIHWFSVRLMLGGLDGPTSCALRIYENMTRHYGWYNSITKSNVIVYNYLKMKRMLFFLTCT